MQVFGSTIVAILQLFALIGLGWLLAHRFSKIIGSPPETFWNTLAKLVYMVSLPALVVHQFATFKWQATHGWFVIASLGALAVLIAVTLMVVGAFRLERKTSTTVGAIAFQPNSAFMGFPFITAVVGPQALPLAVLFAAIEFPFVTAATIAVLNRGKAQGSASQVARLMVKRMAADPVLLGCLLGLVLSLAQVPLPTVVEQPLKWLGGLASPLALLIIGARMNLATVNGSAWPLALTGFIKLAVAPILGAVFASMMGINGEERLVLTLQIAMPVAASTAIMVEQHGGDTRLAANAITTTTLASLLTLAVIAAFMM